MNNILLIQNLNKKHTKFNVLMITYINIIKIDEWCNINNKVFLLFNSKPRNKKCVSIKKEKKKKRCLVSSV